MLNIELYAMNHYWWVKGKKIWVQNMVMGNYGQLHSYSSMKKFKDWVKESKIENKNLIKLKKSV